MNDDWIERVVDVLDEVMRCGGGYEPEFGGYSPLLDGVKDRASELLEEHRREVILNGRV